MKVLHISIYDFERPCDGFGTLLVDSVLGNKIEQKQMLALQVSERLGTRYCQDLNDRVLISEQARTYSEGVCWVR